MILTSPRRHRLSIPLRAAAIAAGALLLPWAPITSGQSPGDLKPVEAPPPLDPPALQQPGDGKPQWPAVKDAAPGTGTKAQPDQDAVEPKLADGSADQPSRKDTRKPRDGDMERRLEKLEAQLKGLMDEVKKMRSAADSGRKDSFDSFFANRRNKVSLGESGNRNYVLKSGDGAAIFFKKPGKEDGVVIAKESDSGKVLWESRVDVSEKPDITISDGQLTIHDRSTGRTIVLDSNSGKQLSRSEGDRKFQYFYRKPKGDTAAAGTKPPSDAWAAKDPKPLDRGPGDERARLEDMLKKLDAQQEDFLAKMKAERSRLIEDLKKLEDQGQRE